MPLPRPAQQALRLAAKVALVLSFVAPLASRLVVGWTFYESGGGKLNNPAGVIAFFTELGIPMPELNAAFVSRLEYYGGMAILVGLGTRFFSFLLSSTMVVALLTADKDGLLEKWNEGGLSAIPEVAPVLLLLLMSWLIFYGPGWLSLDAIVKQVARRKGWLPEAEQPSTSNDSRAA